MGKLTITSSDNQFLVKLIDWLNKQEVEPNSTTISIAAREMDETYIINDDLPFPHWLKDGDALEIISEKLDVETAKWINGLDSDGELENRNDS